MKNYEIHFAEGSYFIAKEKGTEDVIISNTFTEFIGEFNTDDKGINDILNMLQKSYELQKDFPLEEINKPSTTTNEQPTTEQIDNALDHLHGDNSCDHSKVISYLNQFT